MAKRGRNSKRRSATTDKNDIVADTEETFIEELAEVEEKIEVTEERVPIIKQGVCKKGICGKEAACWQKENNTYTCICPHDKSPPTTDWKCTRITVPPTPHPIKNIKIPAETNSTVNRSQVINFNINADDNSTSTTSWVQPAESILSGNGFNNFNVILIGSILSGIAFLGLIIFVLKKRNSHCSATDKSSCSPSPIVLKRSLLAPERYTPNPQYSSCAGPSVPVLRRETLKFLNEIGEGCFGKVFKGELQTDEIDHSDIVAIKVLKESATREIEEDFFREVDIMSAFRHSNILTLLGVVLRESGLSPMMVFEYMPHGDLAEVLRGQRKRPSNEDSLPTLTSKDLMSIAMQIAYGMCYLAAQRFVHRDLACRNCLVAAGPTVKIADFGMSRDVYTCDYYKIGGSRLLPVRWMSPESVMYGRFTLESDVWSYGVVLWEIFSFGKQPYYGHSNEEVVKLILQGIMLIPPEDCPTLICDLMKSCWKTEPRDRIRFVDIFNKLEKVYKSLEDEEFEDEEETLLKYEDEVKLSSGSLIKKLPRPPPLPVDLLDSQGYLLPKEIKEPVQYLQTLPD